jgi:beta-alanine degradation protein BauB
MKTLSCYCCSIVAVCLSLFVAGQSWSGQDKLKIPPKVLMENANIMVVEVNLQPGEKIEGETRLACMVYFLTDCRLRVRLPAKDVSAVDYKAGEVIWREPSAHLEENVGTAPARAIVTVLKMPLLKSERTFSEQTLSTAQATKDNMINSLNNLAASAFQFRIRPKSMGGGEGAYAGYVIPSGLSSAGDATYEGRVRDNDLVQFSAISDLGYGAVRVDLNQLGRLTNWEFYGLICDSNDATAMSVVRNRDEMINDLKNLAAQCYQYRLHPKSKGGGEGSFVGFWIPIRMHINGNGSYFSAILDSSRILFRGVSNYRNGTIQVQVDQDGRMSQWTYTDNFK